jgi:uncharacterized membrane protein
MTQPAEKINDEAIEKTMGNLLRYGVLTSAVVILIGAVFYFAQHGNDIPNFRKFYGEPKRLSQLRSVLVSTVEGRGRSIIQLGLFILIATPIMRVLFSVVGYIIERDFLYVILTLFVLIIILINL